MKKFVDRYLFSKVGMQLVVSVFVVLAFAAIAPLCRKAAVGAEYQGVFQFLGWGLRQVSSPAGAVGTLEALDGVHAPAAQISMLLVVGCCWLVSIAVFSFITGSIVNWFRNRRQFIDLGLVRYKFRDHGIIIGWDFQGASCVRELLKSCGEVLVVSSVPAREIRSELKRVIHGKNMFRVYIYNGSIASGKSTLVASWPELSKEIVILGERNGQDNDGGNLHIERILRDHIKRGAERQRNRATAIKVYMHIEDTVLYRQMLSVEKNGLSENDDLINLEVYNYYESWAWRCWSLKDSCDGACDSNCGTPFGEKYLPLRHRANAERVELFIVGSSLMGQAMAYYAMPLMNYGEDRKHCRITIFDESSTGNVFLPEKWTLDAMPEVEVVYKNVDGGSDEANDIMIMAASDPKTVVTIVIATPGPDAAIRSYAQLANSLRRMDVSILVWQATSSDKCPNKPFLQTCGDQAKLCFFGMTDLLPWRDAARRDNGVAINYYYDVVFNYDDTTGTWKDPTLPSIRLPRVDDANLFSACRKAWRKEAAESRYKDLPRWKKWSSINAGDSFKEKSAAFPDCAANVESRCRLLHAEHNRWWTERLLAGWKPCGKPINKEHQKTLKSSYQHWDMVPFDQLDDFTRDLDKVSIAAMLTCGYIEGDAIDNQS